MGNLLDGPGRVVLAVVADHRRDLHDSGARRSPGQSPKLPMLLVFRMGMAYGVGGTAFNISIRYIGFSLTYSIAVGLSALTKTVVMPLVNGNMGEILAASGSQWIVTGVLIGVLGIAICGAAGRLKEIDFQGRGGGLGEFSFSRGCSFSLLAGVLSAVYGIAMEDVARPIVAAAAEHGAGIWKGNIAYPLSTAGPLSPHFSTASTWHERTEPLAS